MKISDLMQVNKSEGISKRKIPQTPGTRTFGKKQLSEGSCGRFLQLTQLILSWSGATSQLQ